MSLDEPSGQPNPNRPVVFALLAILIVYAVAAAAGWPQQATGRILAAAHAGDAGEAKAETRPGHGAAVHSEAKPPRRPNESHRAQPPAAPAYWTVAPFVLLLGAIALLPLLHVSEHWWESNLNKFLVAAGLGLATLTYYAVAHPHPVERHFLGHALVHPAGDVSWELPAAVLANAILQDFVPFIILLFSLYTISGGIRIQGDLPAHPLTNTAFITVGGLLASFIGTTGAAMLLVRPLLETNSERKHVSHTVVFFIFVVCNCGGCLLPLGDPPLFLGYLQGVDFLWTLSLWPQWLLVNGILLAVYFAWDSLVSYPRETAQDLLRDETRVRRMQFGGLWPNTLLLAGVVTAVALLDTTKTLPGTDWHPWLYLREAVLLALVACSLALGDPGVRQANRFNYGAIIEVAALFTGIFICMQPALQILGVQGSRLGIDTPAEFFWITGALSSVLDNAPTYLVFLETGRALGAEGYTSMPHLGLPDRLLAAVSLGAVFMGANTYIGNGPNFMVKTIAEKSGVRMPSFFGYMVYSGAVLVPIFALVTYLFF
jgi:Na+/H+ antiporter NhaD/arsenite permease-like protein